MLKYCFNLLTGDPGEPLQKVINRSAILYVFKQRHHRHTCSPISQWVKAAARIDGEKVVVGAPEVKQPVAVRYAWEGDPD